MEIYTSYFGNYRRIPQEYQCISIANSKPQGLFIVECDLLKPIWSLVKKFKEQQISYTEFAQCYITQLNTIPAVVYYDKLRELSLRELSQFNPIVLMCWEKQSTICHRAIAAHWLANNCVAQYKGELI